MTTLQGRSPEALSDKELLSLVLDSSELAESLSSAFPAGPYTASYDELRRIKGMTERRAAAVAACYELARRNAKGADCRPVLDSPQRVAQCVPAAVRTGRKEHFIAFYLNARSQLLHFETVSIGTLSASLVHPRLCATAHKRGYVVDALMLPVLKESWTSLGRTQHDSGSWSTCDAPIMM
ncbi:MAG: hypothetical protein HY077_08385 [Elusimicrobia bacterium]|nr:hypothetical protein [Elusimicrobiota bacterium]